VTLLLAVLFWLLFFLNPGERKTLLLIAIYSSFSAVSNLTRFPLTDTGISFIGFEINDLLQKLCLWMIVVMIFVITKTILNFKLFRNFKRFIIAYSLFGAGWVFFSVFFPFWAINVMVDFLAIAYILISSWKKLKGAQWRWQSFCCYQFYSGINSH
jgi:hypothetical protein